MTNRIKWAAIQPLTGGMYLGAEEAIGHPAEFILSYEGLDNVTYDKNGNVKNAANEYNLIQYLTSHNRMPKYYKINKPIFDSDIDNLNPEITLDDNKEMPDYSDLDLVVAVPVCSGLSMATSGTQDTKMSRNCNMLFLANYVLKVIKPKVYCFENAPTLMGSRGEYLREIFEELALNTGYSIMYYKTDTKLHDNPQRRPRTFVIFIQHNTESLKQLPPMFDYEDKQIDAIDFFNRIDPNLSLMTPVSTAFHNNIVLDFVKEKYGNDWTNVIDGSIMEYILKYKLFDELIDYAEKYKCTNEQKEKALKYFNHITFKLSQGLNYYANNISLYKKVFPPVIFRAMHICLHPSGTRMCTPREYLSLMGMPDDFMLYGDESNLPKIGQNVPVNTAKFIVQNIINKIIFRWEDNRDTTSNVLYQNNIHKKIITLP